MDIRLIAKDSKTKKVVARMSMAEATNGRGELRSHASRFIAEQVALGRVVVTADPSTLQ